MHVFSQYPKRERRAKKAPLTYSSKMKLNDLIFAAHDAPRAIDRIREQPCKKTSLVNGVDMSNDALFQPFKLKGLTLPNRVVMPPMTRSFSPGGIPTDEVAHYYRRRAEGRVGLIVS